MAVIDPNEIGFPVGEEIQLNGSPSVQIIPNKNAAGQLTETGEIVIRVPYRDATISTSERPLQRMFSICDTSTPEIFNSITGTQLFFSTKMSVVDPRNAPKELKLIISGTGPKKNSSD